MCRVLMASTLAPSPSGLELLGENVLQDSDHKSFVHGLAKENCHCWLIASGWNIWKTLILFVRGFFGCYFVFVGFSVCLFPFSLSSSSSNSAPSHSWNYVPGLSRCGGELLVSHWKLLCGAFLCPFLAFLCPFFLLPSSNRGILTLGKYIHIYSFPPLHIWSLITSLD